MTYRPRCIKFAFERKSENQTQGFLFDFFLIYVQTQILCNGAIEA